MLALAPPPYISEHTPLALGPDQEWPSKISRTKKKSRCLACTTTLSPDPPYPVSRRPRPCLDLSANHSKHSPIPPSQAPFWVMNIDQCETARHVCPKSPPSRVEGGYYCVGFGTTGREGWIHEKNTHSVIERVLLYPT